MTGFACEFNCGYFYVVTQIKNIMAETTAVVVN
jgi:hypothetical protein